MSQSTREWLLHKYTKAVQAIAEMKTALQSMTYNYENEAKENTELYNQIRQLTTERDNALLAQEGREEVQERLKEMSVGAHVKVYVSLAGSDAKCPYVLVIDSVRTSNGETTIRGHI